MKILVIAEHNNENVKASTFSTINAASQIDQNIDVLVVGTIPVASDSFTLGNNNFMSLAFKSILSDLEATPMIFILKRFAYFSIFVNSDVFPE